MPETVVGGGLITFGSAEQKRRWHIHRRFIARSILSGAESGH